MDNKEFEIMHNYLNELNKTDRNKFIEEMDTFYKQIVRAKNEKKTKYSTLPVFPRDFETYSCVCHILEGR